MPCRRRRIRRRTVRTRRPLETASTCHSTKIATRQAVLSRIAWEADDTRYMACEKSLSRQISDIGTREMRGAITRPTIDYCVRGL